MRDEVVNGDVIRVAGNDYIVSETEKKKITASSLPIKEVYMGRSQRSIPARSGKISSEKNCEELRSVLLGEMVARTVKKSNSLQLRTYARKVKSISRQFIYGITVEYLNIVTGSHGCSASKMIDVVLQGLLHRFGPRSVRPSEYIHMQRMVAPTTLYVVKRIMYQMAITLNPNSLADFLEHPVAFHFCELDLLDIQPRVS